LISHGKLRLRQGLRFDCASEGLPQALNRGRRRLSFTRGRGALE
jgi:hypothetical protein